MLSKNGKVRELPLFLCLLGLLAYGTAFVWYMLTHFNLVSIFHVNFDVSFYYLQIAKNLAAGKFSTFDGGITQTNGYHPIWLLLITPFYWLFDSATALFAIKAFEIMLLAGGCALLVVAARIARLPWILLLAVLPALYQQAALFFGLEAAAALCMLGVLFLALCLYAKNPTRRTCWFLTAVAFSLPWVRLEFAAISLAATAALCLVEWSRQNKQIVVPLLGAASGLLAYFAYNRLVFGGFIPVSGATKQIYSQNFWEREGYGYDPLRNFYNVREMKVFDGELGVAVEICAYLLLVWWSIRRTRRREDRLFLIFLIGAFSVAVGHLAKFAQTVFTMEATFAGYLWHYVPGYLMMALIDPLRCYVALHLIRRFVAPKMPRAAPMLSTAIVIAGTVFLFVKADWGHPFRYVDRTSKPSGIKGRIAYMGTQVMNRVLPAGSVVGVWDSGRIGYFSRFPVVNLDGLVNSYQHLHTTQPADIAKLYRQYGITHFANIFEDYLRDDIDCASWIHKSLSFHRQYGKSHLVNTWRAAEKGRGTIFAGALSDRGKYRFFFWPAQPLTAANDPGFWQRMQPHFHYEADDVGVVVDENLAQIFIEDCQPQQRRGLGLKFAYQTAERGAATSFWGLTNEAKRNHLGLCVDSFELPIDVVQPIAIAPIDVVDYYSDSAQRIIRSYFDVYLDDNQLVYLKSGCGADDAAKFFLHVTPMDPDDLRQHRKQHGYDNHDFNFKRHATTIGDVCMVEKMLPPYAIRRITTGQYVPEEGRVWEGRFDFAEQAGD